MNPRRHTILIVDDEPDVLESLRHLFHRQYRVVTAGGGDEALGLLATEDVHLILSDQRMPGLTGDELLSKARQVRPEAIRLLFTGYADIQAVINAVNQGGIFRYILKPWDAAELEAIVRQAADQFDLLNERRRLIAELQDANARLTEANHNLADANQLKTAFLEVASHELNTPITIIQGFGALLKLLNGDRPPPEAEIINQLSTAAGRLARLVDTMLKLTRDNDFGRPVRTADVDLAGLLRGAAEQVGPFVQARRLQLEINLAEDLGTFALDADKIRDAILNLLTNAIKFTPDGGELSLSARLIEQDRAEIIIADRGIGLEPRALEQLFRPFFTEFDPAQHSSGDFGFRKRGIGLGLSLVKKFIELHGGRVQAESAPGAGTRVVIHLPRHPTPLADRAADSAPDAAGAAPAAVEPRSDG
jgi:signal transduction histidine kinase